MFILIAAMLVSSFLVFDLSITQSLFFFCDDITEDPGLSADRAVDSKSPVHYTEKTMRRDIG